MLVQLAEYLLGGQQLTPNDDSNNQQQQQQTPDSNQCDTNAPSCQQLEPSHVATAAVSAVPSSQLTAKQAALSSCDPELNDWVVIADEADACDVADVTELLTDHAAYCAAPPSQTAGGSSTPGTPASHLTVDDNWTLAPAACFPAGARSPLLPASSLENLLIEHPSMSVYGPGALGPALNHHQQQAPEVPSATALAPSAGPRPLSAAVRTGHITAVQQQAGGKQARKWLAQSALQRNNRAREMAAAGNQRQRRRHHYNVRHSGANNSRKC